MGRGQDYYQVLGLQRDSSVDEIRSAYFELARKYHPDVNSNPEAREDFLVIQEAYETISAPERRKSYDKTLPPIEPGPAITLLTKLSRSTLPASNDPQLVYVLVELVSQADQNKINYPPAHICLVIDRSTSMQGPRMEMIKANVSHFLRMLKSDDMVSVVAFSDRAEVLIPPTRAGEIARIDHQVGTLKTTGGTEIFQGLEAGVRQLSQTRSMGMMRHLVVMTDGRTYGDEQNCADIAQKAAKDGISIHALGIGHEWNDVFLDRITSVTGGTTVFVSRSKDLGEFFERKLKAIAMVYARNIRYQFSLYPHAELCFAFRLQPDLGPMSFGSPMVLGDLLYGKSMQLMFEILLTETPPDIDHINLLSGKLFMEIPGTPREATMSLRLNCAVSQQPGPESPPPAIIEAMSHLSLYRLQEKARQAAASGNIVQATKQLQYLATHLLSQGHRELARSVLLEAEHLQKNERYSQEGDKRIKYGTRALLLPSGLE